MQTTRSCKTAKLLAAIATAVCIVASVEPARAADAHFGVLPSIGNFKDVTLNGNDVLTTATITPFTIVDDSGSGSGWRVTMLVPDFHNGTGDDCTTDSTATVSASSLAMSEPLVIAADNDTSMTGVNAFGFTDFTFARKIITADVGDGAGTYAVTPDILRLIIPASATPGAYCTQATIAIDVGP